MVNMRLYPPGGSYAGFTGCKMRPSGDAVENVPTQDTARFAVNAIGSG